MSKGTRQIKKSAEGAESHVATDAEKPRASQTKTTAAKPMRPGTEQKRSKGEPRGAAASAQVEEALRESEALLAEQKQAFQAAMNGEPLNVSLGVLVHTATGQINENSRAAFYLLNGDGTKLHHVTGMTDEYARCVDGFEVSPESLACGHATCNGEPVITPDVTEEPLWEPWLWLAEEYGYRACWSFPVRTDGGPILGMLAFYFENPREPLPRELEMAATLTHAAAIIISRHKEAAESDRVGDELRRNEADARMLQSISAEMISQDNPLALYEKIVDAAASIMKSDFASMQLLYPERGENGELKLLAFRGFDPQAARFWEWVRADSGCTCGEAMRTGKRAIAADVANCDFMAGTPDRDAYLEAGIAAAQSTPLFSRAGALLGMISTHWSEPHEPLERDLRLFDVLARQAADLLERKRAEEELLANEQRMRALVDALPVAAYTIDTEGNVTHYNEAAAEFAGRRAEIGRDKWCVTHRLYHADGTFMPHDECPMAVTLRTGKPVSGVEAIAERPDGTRAHFMPFPTPLFDEAGNVTGGINVLVDITERKHRELNSVLLDEIGKDLSWLSAPDGIMQAVATRVGEYLRLSGCFFADIDDHKGEVTVHHGWTPENVQGRLQQTLKLEDHLTEDIIRTVRAGEVFIMRDTERDERAGAESYAPIPGRSFVIVPFQREGRHAAHMVVTSREPRDWRADEIELLRDISARVFPRVERARAEEALLESERRFSEFMQNLPGLAWIKDKDGRYVFVNDTAEEIFGHAKAGLYGRTDDEVFSAERAAQFKRNDRTALDSESGIQTVEALEHQDGTLHYSIVNKFPIPGPDGNAGLVGGVAIDITERKKAEEALIESEERLQIALKTGELGSWELNLSDNTLISSDTCKANFGLAPGDDLSFERLAGMIDAEDRGQWRAAVQQAIAERTDFDAEYRVHWTNGETHWISTRGRVFCDPYGAPLRMIGVTQNITERKQAEFAVLESEARLAIDLAGMHRLYGLNARIQNETDLKTALGEILGAACEFTNTPRGCIQLIGDDGERLEMFVWRGYADDNPFIDHFRYEGSKAACDRARELSSRIVIEDVENFEPLAGTEDREIALGQNIRATQSTPLVTRGGEMIGVLSTQFDSPHRPTDEELKLIDLLAWVAADFVERQRSNAALRRSEERYRGIVSQNLGGIAETDLSGAFTTVNDRFCEITGYTREELLSVKKMQDLTHPDDLVQNLELFEKCVNEGASFEIEKRYVRKDGSPVWVHNSVSCVSGADGKPHSLVAAVLDISERTQAEEMRSRLAAIVEFSDDAIVSKDLNGIIMSWNAGAEKLFGYTAAEVLGKSITILIPDDHPDEEAIILERIRRGETIDHYETTRQRKDGTMLDISLTVSPIFNADGKVVGASKIARDITESKQMESNRRLLFDVSETIRRSDEPDYLLYAVARAVGKHFGASRCLFNEIDLDANRETVHRDYFDGVKSVAGVHRITDYSPVTSAEMARGRTVVNYDSKTDERTADDYERTYKPTGERSYVAVPLLRNGEWSASLWMSEDRPRVWTVSEISLLETVAERTWLAVEKLRSEKAMRESEEQYRTLFDLVPVAVYNCDADGFIQAYNQNAVTLWGREPKTDDRFNGAFKMYYPDGSLMKDENGPMARTLRGEDLADGEDELLIERPDGARKVAIAIPRRLKDEKGEIIGAINCLYDVTELKIAQRALIRSERRAANDYQALLQHIVPLGQKLGTARDLISIYRAVHDFICTSMSCSAFFVSFYGQETKLRTAAYAWGEGEEIDISLLPPMPITPDGGSNSQAILDKKSVITNHYWDTMKDRPHVVLMENGIDPMSSLVVPMIIKDSVIGTLEVQAHEDRAFNTEHVVAMEMVANLAAVAIENVRLLEAHDKARQEAEAANRTKDEFLGVLSHELRTPLNSMMGWIRMMRMGSLDTEHTAKAIEVIDRNTRVQSNLIEDLLDVSRIISGKMRVEKELTDVTLAVKTATENMRPIAAAKNINFIVSAGDEAMFADGDPVRLQQIVTNLVQNAIKFTPERGRIEVAIKREGTNAILEICDSGIGIEKELLPLIFDRFRQGDASTKRGFAGLGLGLTIVRTIVELHGGEIKVESDGKDCGSRFTVTLPLSEVLYAETSLADDKKLSTSNGELIGVKILLVDDDFDSVKPLALFLEGQKAEVASAESAAEAMKRLAEGGFDLMITDIGMPGTDGFELVREIRLSENGLHDIPAIAVTAYASPGDRKRALAVGFQEHLAKPVNFDEVLAAVKKLLGSNGAASSAW